MSPRHTYFRGPLAARFHSLVSLLATFDLIYQSVCFGDSAMGVLHCCYVCFKQLHIPSVGFEWEYHTSNN